MTTEHNLPVRSETANPNEDMFSLSADTLNSILPVQFEDSEEERSYNAILFPPRKPLKGFVTRRQHYPATFDYLADISSIVNIVLAQARYIYKEVPILAASGLDVRAIETRLMQNLAIVQADYETLPAQAIAAQALGTAGNGHSHIIKPSTRYSGGYDVLFSGIPGAAYGRTSVVFSSAAASRNPLPLVESQLPDTVLNSDYQHVAYGLADIVTKWLYNTTTTPTNEADKRDLKQLPIKSGLWDVAKLQSQLDDAMKKVGFFGFGKINIEAKMPNDLEKALGKYFSFLVVKEPNHELINVKTKRPGIATEDIPLTKALYKLQVEYGLSIAMNLPVIETSFITQTTSGKRISLTALNTWVNIWARALLKTPRTKLNKGQSKTEGTRLNPTTAPRYILMPSATPEVNARRKQLGMYSENSRANEDNIYVSNTGRFNYCPSSDDIIVENAKAYEDLQEQALQVSFDAGAPLISSQSSYASPYFAYVDKTYRERVKSLKTDLNKYGGSLQTYNWDYNCILTSSRSDPGRLVSVSLAGSSRPDALALSDYLSKPAAEALFTMFPGMADVSSSKELKVEDLKTPRGFLTSTLVRSLGEAYKYLLFAGKMPDLQTLINRAAKVLDINSLETNDLADDSPVRYEIGLYTSDGRLPSLAVLNKNLKLLPNFEGRPIPKDFEYNPEDPKSAAQYAVIASDLNNQFVGIMRLLEAAMDDARGSARSNLMRINIANGSSVEDDPHYFDLSVHNFGEISNVYNYLGGRVFYEMLQSLLKVDKRDLAVVDVKNPMPMPAFEYVVKEIMPFAHFAAKYAPEREKIHAEGLEIREGLKRDTSVTADDIHLPGSKNGFQMFPHQIESMQTLANERPPRFGTLDISPGGGKTVLGLTDIGNLVHRGLIKRPCVLAPNGLVRNWVEDMHMVTEGRWNIIPITTMTYKTWGEERLTKLIENAPINTIFVIGLSFLRLNTYRVVIGNHTEKVSGTLEFCRKFGFDYVILDESHKAKNMRSQTHRAIKQLTVASSVKYVRIATGTLIQTKLTDVVGQAALFGAHIFRTQEEYEAENSVAAGSGRAVVFAKDTPYRARRQLAKYSAVMSFKKKEWAFLLPRPLETFISVQLDSGDDEYGQAHQLMYQAVLLETLEQIKADKDVMALLSGKNDGESDGEDDADDTEADPEKMTDEQLLAALGKTAGGLPTGGAELDEASIDELESALRPYLQRLEMMLTDPLGDAVAGKFFQMAKKENYVSRKVKKIIERIRLNFTEFPWQKGEKYRLKSLCDYLGVRYVLMGPEGKKLTLEDYEELYVSTIPPDKDPRWKPEPMGKVIVFCRYTRSVNAIMRALPPDLKKIAVPFSGGVKNKWGNLEEFRTTPFSTEKGAQILVANEQAISEGHNLQMASRIIRVESPWSPGELDQSSSRIFRPDTTGKFRRENVYLDWVLCNNTLEVAKLGRLISRMVDKAKFDEADNKLYDPLAEMELEPISMSLDTIAATPMLSDIKEYIDAYQTLAHIQSSEFEEMRQTKPSTMFDIPQTEMPKGSAILEHVPYLPGMKSVPDRHNYDLTKLTTFLNDADADDAAVINENKQNLVGMYAHTEFGNGMIVRIREAKQPEGPSKLTSVTVQLANGDLYTADPAMVYLAFNITKENVGDFTPKTRWVTEADKKKAAKLEKQRERERVAEEKRLKREARAEERNADRQKKLLKSTKEEEAKKSGKTAAGRKAKQQEIANRSKRARQEEEEEEIEDPTTVDLYPVVYNGFLAVEATPGEDDETDMRKIGFKNFGDYAYCQIKDYISFHAVLKWLDKKFYLRSETRKRMQKLADSFQTGRGRKFNIELAPVSEFKNFYNITHKMSGKDKESGLPELKIYPVIINGALFLNVDVSTNPIIRRYVGKAIPGTKNVKFEEADGLWIQFFRTRSDVVAWTKKIRADGIEITNYDEFKTQVDDLKEKLKQMQKLTK